LFFVRYSFPQKSPLDIHILRLYTIHIVINHRGGAMKQRAISFTDEQDEYLNAEAKRQGVTVSELVRRIVAWWMDTYPPVSKIEIERKGRESE